MALQPSDLLAITRPVGPEAGTYQLPVAALAEQLGTPPVLGISGIQWSTLRSAADNSWEAVCWSPPAAAVRLCGRYRQRQPGDDLRRWHPLDPSGSG
jgi:hypothetical protein